MSEAPNALNRSPHAPRGDSSTPPLVRMWRRLPVVVRAVIVGWLVLATGGVLTGPLLLANLKLWPAVPWCVPLLAVYMWFFWQYLGGRWWPRSTAEARRQGRRARSLSRRVWRWALIAGWLAMASSFALHWVVGRLAPLHYAIPDLLQQFPVWSLLAIVLVLSAVAGIVEEAAFRGYMQGPIERRHGLAVAIVVVSIMFGVGHLSDWQPSMTVARMFFIVTAAVVYGILVHVTDSIRPGVVLHATGDAIGITWIWWLARHPKSGPSQAGVAAAVNDPMFWVNCLQAIVFGVAAVWAFRRLVHVARSETQPRC